MEEKDEVDNKLDGQRKLSKRNAIIPKGSKSLQSRQIFIKK